jgi:uncharacterized protein involved in outer membrane biogenesis
LEGVADLQLTFAWELASLPKLRDLRLELATARLTRDDQAWFSTERLEVRATEVDLVNRQIKLETISLNQPQALLTIAQNGATNWQSLFPPNEAPSSTDSPNWEISLAEFQWNQGSLQLEHALPNATVNHGISQLNIALANVQYPLSGTTATRVQLQTEQGESVTLNGRLRWRSQAWEGQVQASANLTNWAPYFEDSLPAQLLSGRAKAGAEVSIGWGEPYVQIQQGTLALQNLRLQEPFATEPAIQLADIRAQQIDLAWPQNQLQLDELLLQDGTIRTVRYEDGSLNWQRWMAPKSEAQSEEPHNNAAAPWDVRLNQGRLQDLTFTWQDTTTAAQPLAFQDTQVEVQQLQTRTSSIDNLMLQGALGKTLVRLSGNTRWDAASDLSLDIQNVDLTEWQHLWQSAWPLTFARGAVDVLGRLQIRHDLEKEWLRFDGRLAAQQGVLQVAATGQEMARWQTLQVPQFNLTLEPFQLDTGAVEVDQLVLPLRRLPDESLQWVTLFEPATQEPASTAAPARVNPVVIEQIILRDAHLRWEDQSTDPNVALSLQNIHSRVQNVLGTPAPLQVHLKADWEGVAPISTNFELDWNREPWSVTGTLQTQDFDLLWINPYAQRFLGYQIQRGQLALDLDYQTKGDELQALNKIALNKPVLGRATPNPDAIDAPLQTALSLLRDTRGNVQLDVPVSGRLNDPQFDLSDATGQVLLGLIGSAVSAPFTLLVDAVLDTSLDDNTQQVRFPPGSLEVPEAEQNKLQQLRDVLGEHPEIRMELATLLVPDKEQSALRERELERLLRLEKAAQGIRAGNPVKAEGLTLSAKDRDDLLWVLYRRRVAKEMDLSPEQARSALLNTIRVPEEDLKALALQRAYNVRNLLLGKGFVSAEQIRLTSQVQILNDSQQSSRVELRLRR